MPGYKKNSFLFPGAPYRPCSYADEDVAMATPIWQYITHLSVHCHICWMSDCLLSLWMNYSEVCSAFSYIRHGVSVCNGQKYAAAACSR